MLHTFEIELASSPPQGADSVEVGYRFTEGDTELTYFGKERLSTLAGRWATGSPDNQGAKTKDAVYERLVVETCVYDVGNPFDKLFSAARQQCAGWVLDPRLFPML